MRIVQLSMFEVSLPLRKRVEHASATRQKSDNIVVRCALADGTIGWGEGVPREYVTGESPSGAFEQLAATAVAEQLSAECGSWLDVISLCEAFQLATVRDDPRGCYGNALRCAIELSILDAFGRVFQQSVAKLVEHVRSAAQIRAAHSKVRYSGAIASNSLRKVRRNALVARVYGFAQCKLKVGIPHSDDRRRVGTARRWLGRRVDLRLDANEAWRAGEAAHKMRSLLNFGISCIEQPVPHEEVAGLAEVRRQVKVPIMLDESLTSLVDAKHSIEQQTCDVFNIRLSKCGGFLNSLQLAGVAHAAGLTYQLGCHPGESGILSAAGRHWACSVAGIRYLEGSYDRHLVSERLTDEDLTFGYGGWAPALAGPGLGIHVDEQAVQRLAVREAHYTFN